MKVMVEGVFGEHEMKCVVVDQICEPLTCQRVSRKDLESIEHLKGLRLADRFDKELKDVDMLIGLDHFWNVVDRGEVIEGEEGPMAIKTKFGYVLGGKLSVASRVNSNLTITNSFLTGMGLKEENAISDALNRFWDVESLGIEKMESVDEKINNSIEFNGGRYEVNLPLKEDMPILGDNFKNAKNRVISLGRRLDKNEELKAAYKGIMDEQILEGVIERVENGEGVVGVFSTFLTNRSLDKRKLHRK